MMPVPLQPMASLSVDQLAIESNPDLFEAPSIVFFNKALATSLGISNENVNFFAAQDIPDSAKTMAQAYAGHQFGHFNPMLGDGRAHIIGDIIDANQRTYEFGFKGSGATPFSRGGDGKAALGPMLREVLISEAMHALGIATTRSVAVVKNNQVVFRDPPQPRAVLTRIASSHIRVGTFQFFAARGLHKSVEQLCEYCLARHFPNVEIEANTQHNALTLLQEVVKRQAALIAQWMSVGFIHGVMNTDNMLIGGETIDYGPCAFMEAYNPNAIYSSIDQHGRYAYINQPGVAQWNLSRFAETLLPAIHDDKDKAIILATEAVQSFSNEYDIAFREQMRTKLGIADTVTEKECDVIISKWLNLLKENELDFTRTHRLLGTAIASPNQFLESLPEQNRAGLNEWLQHWRSHVSDLVDQAALEKVNPALIPRNHLVEDALKKAWQDNDYSLFNELLESLKTPFTTPGNHQFMLAAPAGFDDKHVTYCGT